MHGLCMEFGFNGFIIRFWIVVKKRKIRFGIKKSGFGFSKRNAPLLSLEIKITTKQSDLPSIAITVILYCLCGGLMGY